MNRLSKALILGALTSLLGLAAGLAPFGAMLEENLGLDTLFKLRSAVTPPADVIVITIDKQSSDLFGLPNKPAKWPRSYHARLIDNLNRQGARVIAFDMLFDEPRGADDDQALARSIGNARNVVLVEALKKDSVSLGNASTHAAIEQVAPSLPLFTGNALATAPFPLPKVPVKVSRFWTFKAGAGDAATLPAVTFQAFALPAYDRFRSVLAQINPARAAALPEHSRQIVDNHNLQQVMQTLRGIFSQDPSIAEKMLAALNGKNDQETRLIRSLIKLYAGEAYPYLNFYGPPRTITTLPYHQGLQLSEKTGSENFKDKAVFVGFSEERQPEQKDGFYSVFSQPNGLDLSGIEIGATAFANLLEDQPVLPASAPLYFLIIIAWGLLIGITSRFLPITIAFGAGIALIASYFVIAAYQFNTANLWLPLVIPLLLQAPLALFGAAVWWYVDTNKERRRIHKAFGYYLPATVVDELSKDADDIKSSAKLVHGVCLCTDAEKYTSISETLDPESLRKLMNAYYEALFTPVRKHGGIISDVVGDSMLALWTASNTTHDLKHQACLAALDISLAVDEFNLTSDHTPLPTRIGLHSGMVMLGNVGAVDHFEYRAVGDIVNTATRIQTLNKQLGTRILVSSDILNNLEGFLSRELGSFPLAGKSKSVIVHELICHIEQADATMHQHCAKFAEALAAFQERRWREAGDQFSAILRANDLDGPARFYLELCGHQRNRRHSDLMHSVFPTEKNE
ncbi:MAG: adenylate/guanylate cyclase domain-containing protein [Gammaproteobacteria bacterium]|nr:adenylate/guanylate cyclase domain-containing protein [Gammaproteobacteria bacterium]